MSAPNRTTSLYMNDATKARLRELAIAGGVSQSEVMRVALEQLDPQVILERKRVQRDFESRRAEAAAAVLALEPEDIS